MKELTKRRSTGNHTCRTRMTRKARAELKMTPNARASSFSSPVPDGAASGESCLLGRATESALKWYPKPEEALVREDQVGEKRHAPASPMMSSVARASHERTSTLGAGACSTPLPLAGLFTRLRMPSLVGDRGRDGSFFPGVNPANGLGRMLVARCGTLLGAGASGSPGAVVCADGDKAEVEMTSRKMSRSYVDKARPRVRERRQQMRDE